MSNLGNKATMAENIIRYMKEKGVERPDLCKELDVPYTTVCDWINAKSYPRIDKIEMMARYFGINKSDLVEEKPATISDDGLKKLDADLVKLLSSLTPDEVPLARSIFQGIIDARKK